MFRVGLRLHLPRLETGNNPPNLESGYTSTLPNVTRRYLNSFRGEPAISELD